jgi:hypothetical protein
MLNIENALVIGRDVGSAGLQDLPSISRSRAAVRENSTDP